MTSNTNKLTRDDAIRLFIEKHGNDLEERKRINSIQFGENVYSVQQIWSPEKLVEANPQVWQFFSRDDLNGQEMVRLFSSEDMWNPQVGMKIIVRRAADQSTWVEGRITNLESTTLEKLLTITQDRFGKDQHEWQLRLLFISPDSKLSGKYQYLIADVKYE